MPSPALTLFVVNILSAALLGTLKFVTEVFAKLSLFIPIRSPLVESRISASPLMHKSMFIVAVLEESCLVMVTFGIKDRIRQHYDIASPYYYSLWGEHLHHGYWVKGNETKEEAQIALVEHLAKLANIHQGCRLLDIGCGYGGSSIYLANTYKAKTDGITISSVQVEMATQRAAKLHVDSHFFLMDAQNIALPGPYDVIWSIESISDY